MQNNNIAIGKFYNQIDGKAYGSPLASAMADIFMNWLVEIATTKSNRQFTVHHYIDDLFLTFDDLTPTTSIMFLVLSTQYTRKSSLQKKIKRTIKVS